MVWSIHDGIYLERRQAWVRWRSPHEVLAGIADTFVENAGPELELMWHNDRAWGIDRCCVAAVYAYDWDKQVVVDNRLASMWVDVGDKDHDPAFVLAQVHHVLGPPQSHVSGERFSDAPPGQKRQWPHWWQRAKVISTAVELPVWSLGDITCTFHYHLGGCVLRWHLADHAQEAP